MLIQPGEEALLSYRLRPQPLLGHNARVFDFLIPREQEHLEDVFCCARIVNQTGWMPRSQFETVVQGYAYAGEVALTCHT